MDILDLLDKMIRLFHAAEIRTLQGSISPLVGSKKLFLLY